MDHTLDDCERFETIMRRDEPPDDPEIDFIEEHQQLCFLGIHTIKTLERLYGYPSGSLGDHPPPGPIQATIPGHFEKAVNILEMMLERMKGAL